MPTRRDERLTLSARLAALRFARARPDGELRPLVESYWVAENASDRRSITEYWYPDAGLGLVFAFGNPVMIGAEQHGPGVFFDRVIVEAVPITVSPGVRLISIRFRPAAVARFFEQPLHALVGSRPVRDRLGTELAATHRRLATSPEPFAVLSEFLLSRLRPAPARSELVAAALQHLARSSEPLTPARVAEQLGASPRALQRAFAERVGVSLRQYLAISRVTKARALVQSGRPLPEIALAAGYFDQAHFTHEFRSIVGVPPRQYVMRRAHRLKQHQSPQEREEQPG